MMTSIYFNKSIVMISMLFSIILYILVVILTSNYFLSNEKKSFTILVNKIDNAKNITYLISQYIEGRLLIKGAFKNEKEVNGIVENLSKLRYSTYGNTNRTDRTNHIIGFLYDINYDLPSLIRRGGDSYYRSYNDEFLFTTRPVDDYKKFFSKDACEVQKTCSLFSSEFLLKDRILVSNIYDSYFDESKSVISISSPVYFLGNVIGDYNMDVNIASDFLLNKNIKYMVDKNLKKIITLEQKNIFFRNFSYSIERTISNNLVIKYNIPMYIFFKDTWFVFFLFVFISYLFLVKNIKISNSKKELSEMSEKSNMDELTKISNRTLLSKIKEKNDMDDCLSVISIDGNNIKKINDSFGHHIGDEAIKHIASSMQFVFRENDYLFRIGGDEFLVILMNCPLDKAQELGSKLKENTKNKPFIINDLSITISTGIVNKNKNMTIDEALKLADVQLYKDKRNQ
ncbi:GGDEF domain-containing protein [Aliivibrio logei]|uniref:GGDEF domain-containing protein n=1 Tax=Aliivibrio logei TaxID=688 RepID=UPI0020C80181|nr:GGDEF domain-containing protein [Aliivibrio logei]